MASPGELAAMVEGVGPRPESPQVFSLANAVAQAHQEVMRWERLLEEARRENHHLQDHLLTAQQVAYEAEQALLKHLRGAA